MPEYCQALEVEKIAHGLIEEHHQHLADARIAYLFRDKAAINGGIEVWGSTSKVTGKYQTLTGYDFVIEVAEDVWARIEKHQQAALVDHELSHCGVTVEGNYTIHKHDFEGFGDVLRRHGYWSTVLSSLGQAVEQMTFDLPKVAAGGEGD